MRLARIVEWPSRSISSLVVAPSCAARRPGVVPEVVKMQALEAGGLGGSAPDKGPPAPVHRNPQSLVNTRALGCGRTYSARCSSSIAARVAGITTIRFPAAVFWAARRHVGCRRSAPAS